MATLPVSRLLDRIERYYDAAPRPNARIEELGPFTLFVSRGGWPYYARPRLDAPQRFTPDMVRAVAHRQRSLGVPDAFEWVMELAPSLADAVRGAGLTVREHPLMVLDALAEARPPPGVRIRLLAADDPALMPTQAAILLGFSSPGTTTGPAGVAERDAFLHQMEPAAHEPLRDLMRRGLLFLAAAEDGRGPLAGGSHSPRGDVTEVTGIGTLPSERRRGIGAALTAALVADARSRGVDLVFISAGDEVIARVYAKVGFRRIATACMASSA